MAYQIETTCICGDPETSKNHSFGAVSVPIYQTATFAHPGIGESTGHNYTRESNPTRDELEKTVSALEGVVDTVACTSGMAAEIEEMAKTRTHKNLPGVTLPEGIIYTADLEEAMKDKNLLVMAVPSVFLRHWKRSAVFHFPM